MGMGMQMQHRLMTAWAWHLHGQGLKEALPPAELFGKLAVCVTLVPRHVMHALLSRAVLRPLIPGQDLDTFSSQKSLDFGTVSYFIIICQLISNHRPIRFF